MYSNRPTDLHAHKEKVREEIAKLSEETLQPVLHSFIILVHLCIEEGSSFIHSLKRHRTQKVKLCKKSLAP